MTDSHAPLSVSAFTRGLSAHDGYRDPEPGVTVTTSESAWLSRTCAQCGHSFRLGDRVRIGAGNDVQHLTPGLGCGGPEGHSDGVDAFAAGLRHIWRPATGVELETLRPDDWRVRPPEGGQRRIRCAYCAHTLRPGETVITCPCYIQDGSATMPMCRLTVHLDPIAGLPCWDAWQAAGRLTRCPITFRRLAE